MLNPIAAAATPDPAAWFQYGIGGAVAGVLLFFAIKAYWNQVARGDRLEEELRAQNKLIQEKLISELTRATQAIAMVLDRRQRTD